MLAALSGHIAIQINTVSSHSQSSFSLKTQEYRENTKHFTILRLVFPIFRGKLPDSLIQYQAYIDIYAIMSTFEVPNRRKQLQITSFCK